MSERKIDLALGWVAVIVGLANLAKAIAWNGDWINWLVFGAMLVFARSSFARAARP